MGRTIVRKLYYAHPVNLFDSYQEGRDLETLNKLFPDWEIVNPNHPEHQEGYNKEGMDYFREIIRQDFDLLVFRGIPGGKIPAGVAAEIEEAENCGVEIMELPTLIGRDMTVPETRRYLREIGQR